MFVKKGTGLKLTLKFSPYLTGICNPQPNKTPNPPHTFYTATIF